MNVTIIGLGLIGGSIAKDLKRANFATSITGIDSSEKNAQEALKLGVVDKICGFEEGLKEAELVVVAIPVDKVLEVLPKVLDLVPEGATVTEMGSTKRMIVECVKNHPRRKCFIPAHPMSGTENSGPSAAIEGLFKGKITIICDQKDSGAQHLALVEKMFHLIGMDIAYMTAEQQDHTTAFVSHLPHAAAYALANAVQSKEDGSIIFDLASGGFRSTVRLAKSSSSMWHPIFQQNSDFVVESLDVYIKHLQEFRDSIHMKDFDKLLKLIDRANNIRGILEGENQSLIKNKETNVKLYTK